jgi:hypothetical protein
MGDEAPPTGATAPSPDELLRVLSDSELHRLQIGGAVRLRHFVVTLAREGYDRRARHPAGRGHRPPPIVESEEAGVGFAAAFSEDEEFDEIAESEQFDDSYSTVAHHDVVSGPGRLDRRRSAPVADWLAQSRVDAAATGGSPRPARLVVVDVAPLLRLVVLQRRRDGHSRHAGLRRAGLRGYVRRRSHGRVAPTRSDLRGARRRHGCGATLEGSRVSNRARLVGALAYAAMPLGLNSIGQGRVDVLFAVASLPYIVRRSLNRWTSRAFVASPLRRPVPFGHSRLAHHEAGQRMTLIMIVALCARWRPPRWWVRRLVIVGVMISRSLSPIPGSAFRGSHSLGSLVFNVAIFLLPMTLDVVFAGRRSVEIFGLPRGPWSVPSFSVSCCVTWTAPSGRRGGVGCCRRRRSSR